MKIIAFVALAILLVGCIHQPVLAQSNQLILCDRQATPNCFTLSALPTFAGNFSSTWPDGNAAGVLTNNGSGALTWVTALSNPMSGVGDLIRGGSAGAATRLAADTSNVRKFLSEKSTGGSPAAPTWYTLTAADIPAQGSDGWIQYASGGILGATADLTFDTGTSTLESTGDIIADGKFSTSHAVWNAYNGTNSGAHLRSFTATTYTQPGHASADPTATSGDVFSAGALYFNTTVPCLKMYDGAAWNCFTSGGGTPGGANTNIQYNGSGALAGSSKFTWQNGSSTLGVGMGDTSSYIQMDRSAATNASQLQWTVGGNSATTGSWILGNNTSQFNLLYGSGSTDFWHFDTSGNMYVPQGFMVSGMSSTDVTLSGTGGLIVKNALVSATASGNASVGAFHTLAGNYLSISSEHTNAGTTLPISFLIDSSRAMTIGTNQHVLIGSSTDDGSGKSLQVTGGCSGCGTGFTTQSASARVFGTAYQNTGLSTEFNEIAFSLGAGAGVTCRSDGGNPPSQFVSTAYNGGTSQIDQTMSLMVVRNNFIRCVVGSGSASLYSWVTVN